MVCVTNICLSSYRNKFSGCFRAKFSGARRNFSGARGKMRGARRKIYSPSRFSCVAGAVQGARGKGNILRLPVPGRGGCGDEAVIMQAWRERVGR